MFSVDANIVESIVLSNIPHDSPVVFPFPGATEEVVS